jgi:hypothetical protein
LEEKIIVQCPENFQRKKGGPGGTHKNRANAFREMANAISGSGFAEEEDM